MKKLLIAMLLLMPVMVASVGCEKEPPQAPPVWGPQPPSGGDGDEEDQPSRPTEPAACTNIVVAHRGGSTEAGSRLNPDNSLASLRYAMQLGCYASECDIYWTKDNKVVVAHADGNCCINGVHPWEYTLDEIRLRGFLTNGEQIPELEDFIDAVMVEGNCTRLWLDIKNITSPSTLTQYPINAAKRACEIIKEKHAEKFCEFICTGNTTVMASSFGYAATAGINIGWMSNSAASTYAGRGYNWANLSVDYVEGGSTSGSRTIKEFKDNRIALSVFNVDSDADVEFYTSHASDLKAICTNYPNKLINKMK